MKLKYFRLLIVAVCLFWTSSGYALSYSSIVTFGDSLSDNGNVGRWIETDSSLWVEHLAAYFSADLYDYAYGGATTGYDNPAISSDYTGLLWQVDTYDSILGILNSSETLVTVWAGANDFLQSRLSDDAVENIETALEKLYTAGGRNFLVPNLPDIGNTPAFYYGDDPTMSPIASTWTLAYNTSLEAMLYDFENLYSDANLIYFDTFSIFGQYVEGSDEWMELFWTDGFHPSSVGHNLIYEGVVSAMQPVPEPTTIFLFGTGLIGLVGLRRRKK